MTTTQTCNLLTDEQLETPVGGRGGQESENYRRGALNISGQIVNFAGHRIIVPDFIINWTDIRHRPQR